MNQVFILFHGREDPNGNLDFLYVDSIWTSREIAEAERKIILLLKSEQEQARYKPHKLHPYRIQNNQGDFYEVQQHAIRPARFLHDLNEKESE